MKTPKEVIRYYTRKCRRWEQDDDKERDENFARLCCLCDLRVFLARRTRVARIPVSTPKMFKASDCGRLGRQAAGHPWSALHVVKSCRKDCPTASVLLEAKAAALHP